ncbi:MAG: N-acetyltransferase [Gammaproteobacteria bacterium]
MKSSRHESLRIEPVTDRRSLKTFIRLPWTVYRNDPNWVPPLMLERKQAFSPKNPFFQHAKWQAWIAYRGEQAVGRISAQIDQLYLERHQDATGFFGCIEAIDDRGVFELLLRTAENWLHDQGMRRVRGPFSLSVNQEAGLLVDNFDTPPFLMMGHALPYYGPAIENAGYAGAKDLVAYQLTPQFEAPKVMEALCARIGKNVVMRSFRRKEKHAELEMMRDIFNDAWSENWSFTPFTQEEFRNIGDELLPLIPDDFIQIAELKGEAVAFIVLMPNVNEAIADLNGRLLPFGWARLLWRLKVRFPTTGRVALMGVRRNLHNTRLGPALAFMTIRALHPATLRMNLNDVELSWILEDNQGIRSIIESLGGRLTKRYRVYEKDLPMNAEVGG